MTTQEKINELDIKIKKQDAKVVLSIFGWIVLMGLFIHFGYDYFHNSIFFFCFGISIVFIIVLKTKEVNKMRKLEYEKHQLEALLEEEENTFEGVITLLNGDIVNGVFIKETKYFFEKNTKTCYYKDKIISVQIKK